MKQWKKEKVGACSLIHNISRQEGMIKLQDGTRTNSQQEIKMRSTCTTKKRGRLVQVEWKWCGGLNRDNLKHKLYTACNLWEEAPLPSLQYTLCVSIRATSKCHFSLGFPSKSPKIGTLVVPKLWTFIYFSYQAFFESVKKLSYSY